MTEVTITWVVNRKSGEIETTIEGIKGSGCQPIHYATTDTLAKLGISEVSVTATEELGEGPNDATAVSTAGW